MGNEVEVVATSVKGEAASVVEVLKSLGLSGRFGGGTASAMPSSPAPSPAGSNASAGPVDEPLVAELVHQFRRRGLSRHQRQFLDLLAQRPTERITATQVGKELGTDQIRFGGVVGGLGLRLREVAAKRGIQRNPVQAVLELSRRDHEKAYRFTPTGLEAYRRYRSNP